MKQQQELLLLLLTLSYIVNWYTPSPTTGTFMRIMCGLYSCQPNNNMKHQQTNIEGTADVCEFVVRFQKNFSMPCKGATQ
jgi:hypothetical protein